MTIPDNTLRPKSSKGWEISQSGRNIADDFPSDFSKPSFRTLSLTVKEECEVDIQVGRYETETLHLIPEKGLELSANFAQIYSFSFKTDGVNYYWLCSY